jgi:hypothetical protein
MNAIGFVFCILAILSFGAIAAFEKQVGAYRLRAGYLGHIAANRQILDQTTSEFYASLKQAPEQEAKEKGEKEKRETQNQEPADPPALNPHCARLNLFPLVERDFKEAEDLYEAAAKLLRVFYGEALFGKKVRAEYKFLDACLKEARLQAMGEGSSALEKISLHDPQLQMMYYKMLKGTKKNDLLAGVGYPSLLDYVKIERTASKICLFHAHPNLLAVFFTPKGAAKLYAAMHVPKAPALSRENIERICHEVHAPLLDPEVLDLFEIDRQRHGPVSETTLIGKDPDTHVSLRKVVALHSAE